MAKYPIPVHVAKQEGGGADKIIYAAARVKELGANAFIVSTASLKKLEEGGPAIDFEAAADSIEAQIRRLPAVSVPKGLKGAVLRGLRKVAE